MAGDRVAGLAFDLSQGPLELVVGERLDLAAVLADEMVVVLAVGVDRLEARDAGADVDPLHEAFACQLLEGPVDARDADGLVGVAEHVEDLLRGQAAVLEPEELNHGSARAAVAVALRPEGLERGVDPLGASSRHGDNDSGSRFDYGCGNEYR